MPFLDMEPMSQGGEGGKEFDVVEIYAADRTTSNITFTSKPDFVMVLPFYEVSPSLTMTSLSQQPTLFLHEAGTVNPTKIYYRGNWNSYTMAVQWDGNVTINATFSAITNGALTICGCKYK